jgi:hypothetical protein
MFGSLRISFFFSMLGRKTFNARGEDFLDQARIQQAGRRLMGDFVFALAGR